MKNKKKTFNKEDDKAPEFIPKMFDRRIFEAIDGIECRYSKARSNVELAFGDNEINCSRFILRN